MSRRLPKDKKSRGQAILAIQNAIESTFDESDWKALGYQLEFLNGYRIIRDSSEA